MKEFSFLLRAGGTPQQAVLRFATRQELRRYHRSLSPFAAAAATSIREAVEFTRLAAKRWRYYARGREVAESFAELAARARGGAATETAFILVASLRHGAAEVPLGLAYCRRTWCHHLALDFLAVHPGVLSGAQPVSGVGSGIIFGLVQLAEALRIPRLWGEATANSAAFYERLLATGPVQDLFIIEAPAMAAIRRRQAQLHA